MFNNPIRAPRPRLTLRILGFACADIFGLTALAIGATWFIENRPAVLATFPGSMAEAVVCSASGLVLMVWGVVNVLKEMAKQAPEMQEKYTRYVADRQNAFKK